MEKSKINKTLEEAINYLKEGEGWDKQEFIDEILHDIKGLNGWFSDEIRLEWGGNTLMVLDDFTKEFYNLLIKGVCNIIESFKENEDE